MNDENDPDQRVRRVVFSLVEKRDRLDRDLQETRKELVRLEDEIQLWKDRWANVTRTFTGNA